MEGQCLYCTYLGVSGSAAEDTVKVFMPHDLTVDVHVCARHKAEKSIEDIRDAFLSLAAHAKMTATAPPADNVRWAAYPCQCAQPQSSTSIYTCAKCGGRMRP